MHVVDTMSMGGLQNGLVNLMDRLDPVQFEHVLCAMRPVDDRSTQPFLAERAQLMCLTKKDADSRFQALALSRRIREVKPDIVHSRNWGSFEALLAARWNGSCALVHSEHGIDWDTTTTEPRRRVFFRRLAFELADRVLAVSSQLRDLHAKRTGFPARKIEVIHNGVDGRRFSPDAQARARVRQELGLSEDELCIGCVGNLIPVKDHLTLLKAVDGFGLSCRQWRLLIIGEGPELPKLAEFVNNHEVWKDRVCFLGRSSQVPDLLRAMDVFVLSSVTEGISNSVLEAMATALPVIVTTTGGNPEVVIHGESGLLFPVGDFQKLTEQLVLLRTQNELRVKLGQGALERVREKFSIDSMVRKYEEVYGKLRSPARIPLRAVAGA
jgi:sugar transferase (PEP-CTERM/EpsH1 system associated)